LIAMSTDSSTVFAAVVALVVLLNGRPFSC
jgi:hypothetical protein